MARITHRANLNASGFPLVSLYQGQTVIVRGQDTNYVPAVNPKADDDRDVGIPQVYYCHNVLPIPQGLAAVAFEQKKSSVPATFFKKVITIRDGEGITGTLGVSENSSSFYWSGKDSQTWAEIAIPGDPVDYVGEVTTAFVAGTSYIYIERAGCYKYNFATGLLETVTLTGLDASEVIGIAGSSGYLIAWTASEVAWSSTVTPTDFVPDLTTGAGGGGVEGARGSIVHCAPTSAGFVVYTTVNAVASSYSGNTRYPFNFKEIIGCGGISSSELVSADGANGYQYAFTTYGLQAVSFQQGQIFLSDWTDFVSGSFMEDFNEVTDSFEYQELSAQMKKKLQLIAGRYLILSYGVAELTHALVYDLGLKRAGKLKLRHVDVYDYSQSGGAGIESAKESIAFVQDDGSVYLAVNHFGSAGEGVLIIGKYQVTRTRQTHLDGVRLENVRAGAEFLLSALVNYSGKETVKVDGWLNVREPNYREYNFSCAGRNISLLFKGSFHLTSLVLDLHQGGRM